MYTHLCCRCNGGQLLRAVQVSLSPLISKGALATDTTGCSLLHLCWRSHLPCQKLQLESHSQIELEGLHWCHDLDGGEV